MLLPRCSPKRLLWIFVLLIAIVMFNIWYMLRVVDVKYFLDQFQDLSFRDMTHSKRILLWNKCEKLTGLDIQCLDYNCLFSVREKSNVRDLHLYTVLFDENVLNSTDRPKKRWDHQIYVFWSLMPPCTAPACGAQNDNFFNWTFTYRLDSTLVWNYFVVRNINSSEIVAPNKLVKWEISIDPLSFYVENILEQKTKTLAWVKTCKEMNRRENNYLSELLSDLTELGVSFDVFNECSATNDEVHKVKEDEYQFLIAFEDVVAEDYVTDKVLRAYNNYAVPIVYGGANYSWFLPEGSYLDASITSPLAIAHAVKLAMRKPSTYASFFNWTNLYQISAYPVGMHPLCSLCSTLNSMNTSNAENVKDFRRWWNTPEGLKSCNKTN